MKRLIPLFILLIMTGFKSKAQNHNAQNILSVNQYMPSGNVFRSANGAPGEEYWQNSADYKLDINFDTVRHVLSGTTLIHYQNNSPNQLHFLWLYLDQNIDKDNSRARLMRGETSREYPNAGFHIENVRVKVNGKWQEADYLISDTRMQIRLKQPLTGNGSRLDVKIDYHFKLLEKAAGGRAGWLKTPQGTIFEVAYFYPRMCVYDDLHGWNTLPYLGNEFYCEYGNFDYKITVPSGMLVVSAGRLINAQKILSDNILNNIQKALSSDTTVIIRSARDVQNLSPTKKTKGTTTWHFKMKHTRDVAFACSHSFVWDGMGVILSNGDKVFAQSAYPAYSAQRKNGWQRASEMLKANLNIFSKWYPYPYTKAINVAGRVGGMEFPGITFDWHKAKGKVLWMLVSHEIGHTWFPMLVGSNERRHPFMDEGFNTFMDVYAQQKYNHGEFAPKRDGEYAPNGGQPADEIIPVIKELQGRYTLMDLPDDMPYKYVHPLFYFKTAFGLVLLREVILGKDRFDYAFKTYIRRWVYKHPSPMDFFRIMNNASGEDLTWFWQSWFYHNWLLDQAVLSVHYNQDNPKDGSLIKLKNKDKMPMPVLLKITEEDGNIHQVKLPVEIWMQGNEYTYHAKTTSKIMAIEIDPKHQLPDVNRQNNIWKATK